MADYPDFTVIARLKGEYAGAEKAVALDADGALQTLLYGTYSGANKKILTDIAGNVRMNLYAQDLDEMVNRFKYGAPLSSGYQLPINASAYTTFYGISGKGYIYYCDIALDPATSHASDHVKVTMDGEAFVTYAFGWLNDYRNLTDSDLYVALRVFDDTNFMYRVNLLRGFTFESTVVIQYMNTIADTPSVTRLLLYTLI